MNKRAGLAALLIAGLLTVAGAQTPAAGVPQATALESHEDQVLDEVIVRGTQLWRLRKQMKEVEDQFYALYNKLNKDQDFDVHCHIETPTDRIIKERVCRVAYIEDAQEIEVKALLDGHSAPPADMVAQARYADFEKNFLRVINGDRRLRKLVREREALGERYSQELKRRYADHTWFRFEK